MRTPCLPPRLETAARTTANRLDHKQAALRRGRAAETAVAHDLASRGWQIWGTNVRLGRLELDVVARDGDTVVVIEVRTRGSTAWQSGLESVVGAKTRRVRAAGEKLWRHHFERDPTVNRMRFDVAVVTFAANGDTLIEYARGVM
jgi:putative endonuclease